MDQVKSAGMDRTPSNKLRIVCTSDTHNAAPGEGYTLPKGDVLIHAGDLTIQGSLSELKKALAWLERADFALKIVIAGKHKNKKWIALRYHEQASAGVQTNSLTAYLTSGNHDLSLDRDYKLKHAEGWTVQQPAEEADQCRALVSSDAASTITYLQHESTVIEVPGKEGVHLRVFGSPFSPDRGNQNWAFQYTEDQAQSLWGGIPTDTDIVITHTPPAGYCDISAHWKEGGCPHLLEALWRTKPLLHICGHCHEGRGAEVVRWSDVPNEIESVRTWEDSSKGNKKQSLLDLTGARGGFALEAGRETAVVNASIMARSFGRGAKVFNKPIVLDVDLTGRKEKHAESDSCSDLSHAVVIQ